MTAHYQLHCQRCGKAFNATRPDARYCTGVCRTLMHRDKNVVQQKGKLAQQAVLNLFAEWEKPYRNAEAERWLRKIMSKIQERLSGATSDDL